MNPLTQCKTFSDLEYSRLVREISHTLTHTHTIFGAILIEFKFLISLGRHEYMLYKTQRRGFVSSPQGNLSCFSMHLSWRALPDAHADLLDTHFNAFNTTPLPPPSLSPFLLTLPLLWSFICIPGGANKRPLGDPLEATRFRHPRRRHDTCLPTLPLLSFQLCWLKLTFTPSLISTHPWFLKSE